MNLKYYIRDNLHLLEIIYSSLYMDIDKEDIDELKIFIKEQQRIERALTKDQIKIRRLFHPDGRLVREILEILDYYKNKMKPVNNLVE